MVLVAMNAEEAEIVRRFLSRIKAGDRPEVNGLVSIMQGLTRGWEAASKRGA